MGATHLMGRTHKPTQMKMNFENTENHSQLFDIKELAPYIEINKIGSTSIKGRILPPVEENINALKDYFADLGFLPFFDNTSEQENPHIINLAFPKINQTSTQNLKWRSATIAIILFVATVFTTLLVGSFNRGGNPFHNIKDLILGLPFSFSLLLILTGHELGHYFTSRHYGVSVTLPYFLPIPHPLIGTMGAFIRIKSVLPNRRALVRIGLAGPLTGFILAIPITVIGLALSKAVNITEVSGVFSLGSSLLFQVIYNLLHPAFPKGYDLILHPMAFAGWLGFFVTAINLLPIGQLDGGHIVYATLGKYRKHITIFVIAAMALLGILWPGWFFWILLILVFGLRHPKTQDEITKLKKSDKILAGVALIILILAFIPNPFSIR